MAYRSPRPSFVVTLTASAAAVVFLGCSSDGGATGTADGPDTAGPDTGCNGACNPPPPCPTEKPVVGAACTRTFGFGPEICSYPDTCSDGPRGSQDTLECDGTWKLVSTDYAPTCPGMPPFEGLSCLCGSHHFGDCNYGSCNGAPTLMAHCDPTSGTWTVTRPTCNPPRPDVGPGPADGGDDGGDEGGDEGGDTDAGSTEVGP